MGQLTAPGSALLEAQTGQPTFMGSPNQVLGQTDKMLQQRAQGAGGNPLNPADMSNLPKIGQPSFQQAASAGAMPGGANALSPGLNKAGKLATLLMSGLQGALAGRAKSEETVAATGGRRAGGAGMGFEAGYMLPWQRAGMAQELAQKQAQTGLLQSEAQTTNIPGIGPIPGWLAKAMGPAYLRQQGQLGSAELGKEGKLGAAQINKRFVVDPNVGIYDTQQGAWIPGSQQGITVTPEIAQDLGLPQEFVGKPMKLSDLASNKRADVFQNVPQMTAQGPIVINRKNATARPVQGPGGQTFSPPALASPREVGDVNNPGQTVNVPAGQAFGKPGVQSASVQVPRAAAKAEVPTQIGNQKVAFTTALQHADLLKSAISALNNGDQNTLNSLKNRFKAEFGATGPVTAEVIASAYTREINKMLSAGHITDSEIGQIGKTLNVNRQAPQQSLGVLDAYRALAQSKMNMLNQQKASAIQQSQPGGGNEIHYDVVNGQLVPRNKPK